MDKIYPPAIAEDQTPQMVPYVVPKSDDAGSAWARSLPATHVADLVDLAGELAQTFSILSERRVTKKAFLARLKKDGKLDHLEQRLLRVVGFSGGYLSLYDVWWSWAWVYNYNLEWRDTEATEEEVVEKAAQKMGVTATIVRQRLVRRDIGYMVNLFLGRIAREMKGEVMIRATRLALQGNVKAIDTYFNRVAPEEERANANQDFDPLKMSEHALMAEVAQLRKSVGMHADEIRAEVEIKDAEFEEKSGPETAP